MVYKKKSQFDELGIATKIDWSMNKIWVYRHKLIELNSNPLSQFRYSKNQFFSKRLTKLSSFMNLPSHMSSSSSCPLQWDRYHWTIASYQNIVDNHKENHFENEKTLPFVRSNLENSLRRRWESFIADRSIGIEIFTLEKWIRNSSKQKSMRRNIEEGQKMNERQRRHCSKSQIIYLQTS